MIYSPVQAAAADTRDRTDEETMLCLTHTHTHTPTCWNRLKSSQNGRDGVSRAFEAEAGVDPRVAALRGPLEHLVL